MESYRILHRSERGKFLKPALSSAKLKGLLLNRPKFDHIWSPPPRSPLGPQQERSIFILLVSLLS